MNSITSRGDVFGGRGIMATWILCCVLNDSMLLPGGEAISAKLLKVRDNGGTCAGNSPSGINHQDS